jgi:hypothetical protein
LRRHFQAHYGTAGALKFYHSGQVHIISGQTGSQQGDPLGTVLFSAPLQSMLHKVADSHPQILVFASQKTSFFLVPACIPSPQSTHTINCLVRQTSSSTHTIPSFSFPPHESSATKEDVTPTLTTPQGFAIPCTTDGIKLLGSPIGTYAFTSDLFSKIGSKNQHDLTILQAFPHLHQRAKLLTFGMNTRLIYFLCTAPPNLHPLNHPTRLQRGHILGPHPPFPSQLSIHTTRHPIRARPTTD